MATMFKQVLIAFLFNVIAILGLTFILPAKAADPESDLSVSFENDGDGFVVGEVENKSGNNYPCVHLKFFYSGAKIKTKRFFSTEVKNIGPHSTVQYKEKLPFKFPSFGLESRKICQSEGPPKIISFKMGPARVNARERVKFFWEVKDAKRVRLFEDDIEFTPEQARVDKWPLIMSGWYSSSVNTTTTYMLVAENRKGKTTRKTFTVQVVGSQPTQGPCILSGKLTGKFRQRLQERPGGPLFTFDVPVVILSHDSKKQVDIVRVDSKGRYKTKELPAGKYIVRPAWTATPQERTVSCGSNKNQNVPVLQITGAPRID